MRSIPAYNKERQTCSLLKWQACLLSATDELIAVGGSIVFGNLHIGYSSHLTIIAIRIVDTGINCNLRFALGSGANYGSA